MRTTILAICAWFLLAPAAGICLGGEIIEPGEVELYPTYNAVGIEIPYLGDDDASATAEFVWKRSAEVEWHNGVEMTLDRKKRFAWASIWPLDQGETVEVQFTIRDIETVDGRPVLRTLTGEAAATTKTMILENTGGGKHYVSTEGSNDNTGTEEKPFRTIARAASAAAPGDTVYVTSGVYHEGDLCKGLSGEPGRPIIIAAAPGHKPVIDGSVEIAKGSNSWSKLEGDIYAGNFSPETGYAGYVAQDGLRMFWYGKYEDFESDKLGAKRAWHFDDKAGKLYIRTGDSSTPADHTYNVAVRRYALYLSGSRHVTVKGLRIRHFGRAAVLLSEGATGCILADNSLHNVPIGVFLKGENTTDNAIWRNEIYETGLVDFTWTAIKRSNYPRQGITGFAGRGTSICHNTIHGFFDGIAPVSWRRPDELGLNRDMDIMYNEIRNVGDDAIEIDGGGVNMRIHKNKMRNVFAAISLAPVERGPVYTTRNDATYYMLMFKLNVGGCTSLGWAYSYHNSGYSLINIRGDNYGGIAVSFPASGSIPITNKVFMNNAFIANIYGIRSAHKGEFLNHNSYFHVPGDRPLRFMWEIKDPSGEWKRDHYSTLDDFRNATGQEQNGIYADPLFLSTPDLGKNLWSEYGPTAFSTYPQAADSSTGDLSLKPESPCIDAGALIRGINEGFKGRAPDIGAFEH